MDFKQLASTILANVGGKENVDKVVHWPPVCALPSKMRARPGPTS